MKDRIGLVAVFMASLLLTDSTQGGAIDDLNAFTQGQKIKFDSKGSSKAKGMRLTIEYPSTWRAEDGNRPNVVHKFIGNDESGNFAQAILLVKDVPLLARLAKDEMLKEDFLKENVTEMGGVYVKSGATKIDGENAAWVICIQDTERVGIKMRMKTLMFMTMFKGKHVQLMCIVGGLQNDPMIDQRFAAYLPVFQLIGNSIVFHDKWK